MTGIPPDLQSLIHQILSAPQKKATETELRLAAACEALTLELTRREQLDHSRHHLAAIVQSANVGILSQSLEGIIQSWNPGAERLFGYTAEEVVNRSIFLLLPEGSEGEEEGIQARLKRGELVQNYDTVRRHKDGRLLPVSLTVSPVWDDEKRIIGASKIIRDLGDRREREAQAALISQLQSALAEVKALRGFIPICAHCKKIRDDAGYWQGLEQYLGKNSTARFSHGVCPSCLEKHYGEWVNSQLI